MGPRSLFVAVATAAAVAFAALAACSQDPPEVVGLWRNGTNQLMVVGPDLTGVVYQEAPCTPSLRIHLHRDPYDAYAVRFEDNQSIYFPLAQKELFAPAEYFCASKDSVPMCQFCRLEGDTMSCSTTEQKITGRGVLVTHDCAWRRLIPGTGTSTTPVDAGLTCPGTFDAGGGCRPNVDDRIDAGDADAGVRDAAAGD